MTERDSHDVTAPKRISGLSSEGYERRTAILSALQSEFAADEVRRRRRRYTVSSLACAGILIVAAVGLWLGFSPSRSESPQPNVADATATLVDESGVDRDVSTPHSASERDPHIVAGPSIDLALDSRIIRTGEVDPATDPRFVRSSTRRLDIAVVDSDGMSASRVQIISGGDLQRIAIISEEEMFAELQRSDPPIGLAFIGPPDDVRVVFLNGM